MGNVISTCSITNVLVWYGVFCKRGRAGKSGKDYAHEQHLHLHSDLTCGKLEHPHKQTRRTTVVTIIAILCQQTCDTTQ